MIRKPMDILELYPVRKNKKQKQAFREDMEVYAKELGYPYSEEKGSFGSRSVVLGNPQKAKYLVTAHYDTCARMLFPNLITPCNFWTFLGYQLFTVSYMFAFVFVAALVTMLLTRNEDISFYIGYAALWVFLLLIMVGPANKHNANDNTSGVVTALEIARMLPEAYRENVCFVLFDLEEAGLIGSASYARAHKNTVKKQLVLNLDCVGDGDEILLFPTGKLKKNLSGMDALDRICGSYGSKILRLQRKGFSVYPSDQGNFPYGVGIAAFHSSCFGLYLSRIHTPKDTVLEEENVIILRDRLICLITGDVVE